MSDILRVIKPGSDCMLGGILVKILSVRIEAFRVSYEVSWIFNGDRKTAWIEVFEIEESNSKTLEVGFE